MVVIGLGIVMVIVVGLVVVIVVVISAWISGSDRVSGSAW